MNKFENVLLLTDFDGTFANDNGVITEDNIEMISYFTSHGGHFSVSTGRTYQGFHHYNKRYINAPVLLANGAMAFDYEKNEIYFHNGLGFEGREAIKKILNRFPDLTVEMYPFNETYAINLTDISHRHFSSQGIAYQVVNSPDEVPVPWAKSMIACEKTDPKEVHRFMDEFTPEISYIKTTGEFIEVLAKGVDKGSGLMKLARCLNVAEKDAYAVGDGLNDMEMIVAASKSFVPENGNKDVLKAADYVVRSNNNGAIANVIEILDKIY
ncbi:MAG: Cof-type HAD-IIB family hydrolase [Ruminococcaceae bacterium]|nr:Cof-type HAD-IIB family hydrolase [Oscillospiraceae bacterium]